MTSDIHFPFNDEAYDRIVSKHTPEQQKQPEEPEGLKFLLISKSDPTATAKELARLIAARDDFLFNGYTPVRIAVEADGLPRALEVTIDAVRILAHKICTPVKSRQGELVAAPLSKDIAQLYLNLEGEWGLKSFRGITTAPILRDDGNIRVAAGFDHETGLWCSNIPDVTIPAQPTEDDARAALRSLREYFQTFPYADGVRVTDLDTQVERTDFDKPIGLDESTFLVALLTAVCRQSLELAPGIMVRAPTFSGAGTGKGLASKPCALSPVVQGHPLLLAATTSKSSTSA